MLFSPFLWNIAGLQHIEQDERVSVGLNGNLYFSNAIETDSRRDYCCFAAFPRIRTIVQKTAMSVVVKSSTFKYSFSRVWFHNVVISLHGQHWFQTCRPCASNIHLQCLIVNLQEFAGPQQISLVDLDSSCDDLLYFMSILSVFAVFALPRIFLFVSISSSKTS